MRRQTDGLRLAGCRRRRLIGAACDNCLRGGRIQDCFLVSAPGQVAKPLIMELAGRAANLKWAAAAVVVDSIDGE